MSMRLKFGDIAVMIVVILVVLLIILPVPPGVINILIAVNIGMSLLILLIAMGTREALEFSTFPSLLLIITLYRLALNVSSTVQILGNRGNAGEVIRTFGEFVTGGNMVVGAIMFIIIMLIQLIVITRGAERISEVAARFTLDAMPGKQMAIDADLSAGLIDETTARSRREKIRREADFYGAMDGASKFVKGESIMGIIITIVNFVGGVIIEVVMNRGSIETALTIYGIATIGDGLSAQIPALLISTAMGIVVTKAATEESMGADLVRQLGNQPAIMMVVAGVLAVLSLMPGMPRVQILILAGGIGFLGFMLMRSRSKAAVVEEAADIQQEAAETRKPENVVSLLRVDPIEMELGYALIPMADPAQGGDLMDRMVMIRRQCAVELGLIVPVIRMRDNIQLAAGQYIVKLRGEEVASGEVVLDHYLAMGPEDLRPLPGVDTLEPAFGLPAKWVGERDREQAELMGCTLVDPPSVIATHMTEVIRRHAHELLGRQQAQALIDNLRQSQPTLVDEVVPKIFSLGEVQRVLANLLREGVSIRDMGTILETIGDHGGATHDLDLLTEYVRQALRRAITRKYVPDRKARVITLDPVVENAILDNIRQSEHGSYVSLEADTVQRIFQSLRAAIDRVSGLGLQPIVLTSPVVRFHFKRLVEQFVPDLVVLSYNELEQNVAIQADGIVRLPAVS